MKTFKYTIIIIGLLGGVIFSFLEFSSMDKLDENLEFVIDINYDKLVYILPYSIVYGAIGALFGGFLWLMLRCFIWLMNKIKIMGQM